MIDEPLTPYQSKLLIAMADPKDVANLRIRLSRMRSRCNNPGDGNYPRYGGRGIAVAEEWMNGSENFLAWALSHGFRKELSIDRIDNDGPYSPGNCRMANAIEQGNNRRTNVYITVGGVTHTRAEWARIIGVSHRSIIVARNRGWPEADYIAAHLAAGKGKMVYRDGKVREPPRQITVRGQTHTLSEWVGILGVTFGAAYNTCKNRDMPYEAYISAHLDAGYGAHVRNYDKYIKDYAATTSVATEQKEEQ